MNDLEKAIAELKYYIEIDPYWNGKYKPLTDFEEYCYKHCEYINELIKYIEGENKCGKKLKKNAKC